MKHINIAMKLPRANSRSM